MSHLNDGFSGAGLKVTQNSREFYVTAVPASTVAEWLGYMKLEWSEQSGEFNGFNREVKSSHVDEIVKYIKSDDAILPNAIIVYLLHPNFEFSSVPFAEGDGPEVGIIKFKVPYSEADKNSPIGFVIDGQHRLTALDKISTESGEEELMVPLVIFHAPYEGPEKNEFDSFILRQMDKLNRALPLSDNEKLTVRQILGRVDQSDILRDRQRATANLIVRALDKSADSPLRFRSGGKKPLKDSGLTWMDLSVWVNCVQETLTSQTRLNTLFKDKDFQDDGDARGKATKILGIYLKAIRGLVADKTLWEASAKDQRLYHNVGLLALMELLDFVNSNADVVSKVDPGKVKLQSEDAAIKKFQSFLAPIRLLDWRATPSTDDSGVPVAMAGIQKQKRIPAAFRAALKEFLEVCKEFLEESTVEKIEHLFEIKDSTGLVVCKQKVIVQRSELKALSKSIENGDFVSNWPPVQRSGANKSKK